jgi:hypothetical protein
VNWDIILTVALVFTSLVTPFRIAFVDEDDLEWSTVNNVINFLFFIDILVSFISAYQDEELKIIDDRKKIAVQYLKSWFAIDILSVFPFDMFFNLSSGA